MNEPIPQLTGVLSPIIRRDSGPPSLQQDAGINVGLVIRALRRYWIFALPVGVAGALVAAAIIWWRFVPQYEASAWLQIDERPTYVAFQASFDSARFVQTQIELIRSPLVMGPVAASPEVAAVKEFQGVNNDVVSRQAYLSQQVKIKAVGGSELYTVTWSGPSGEDAATIVNRIVNEYLNLRSFHELERAQKVIRLVQEERDRQEQELHLLQERFRTQAKQAAEKDPAAAKPTDEKQQVISELASLQGKLTDIQVRRVFLKAELAAYEESPSHAPSTGAQIEKAIAEHPRIRELTAQLHQQQQMMEDWKARLTKGEQDPRYQAKLAAVRQDEAALEKARLATRREIEGEMEQAGTAARAGRLKDLKSEMRSADLTEELLKKRLAEVRQGIVDSSGSSVDLAFLKSDLGRAEDVFERVASRLVTLRTEQRAPTRVTRLQDAQTPTMPVVASPVKTMAMAAFGLFFLPFALAVLVEKFWERISDPRQIREQVRLPLVSEVARLPLDLHASGTTGTSRSRRDVEMFRESIETLRVALATTESLKEMRVLAVTSAATNEGKTSVAVQLGVSIARASGMKVLLIDGDMRSPDIHRVLGIVGQPGLVEVLTREAEAAAPPIVPWSNLVDVLPAGKLRRSPHRLLGDGGFLELLAGLREQYRMIIIDTPPVLAASEALILSRAADAVLLCAMRDVSRVDQVSETHARLNSAGAHPIGVVLNGVPPRVYGYRYGRYEPSQGQVASE